MDNQLASTLCALMKTIITLWSKRRQLSSPHHYQVGTETATSTTLQTYLHVNISSLFLLQIEIFRPLKSTTSDPKQPPSPEHEGFYLHSSYTYHDLPPRYWKKYQYAAQFVQLVRSKTPKVTLYTEQAKCMLMENGPSPDFEACFYNGRHCCLLSQTAHSSCLCVVLQCSSRSHRAVLFQRSKHISCSLITFFQPHKMKIVYLRVMEHHSSTF